MLFRSLSHLTLEQKVEYLAHRLEAVDLLFQAFLQTAACDSERNTGLAYSTFLQGAAQEILTMLELPGLLAEADQITAASAADLPARRMRELLKRATAAPICARPD